MYRIMLSKVSDLNIIEKWVLGKRTKKSEIKEERWNGNKLYVCDNTDTKIRVNLKKNILILLNTAERSIMVRTGNAVDLMVWQGVLLLPQPKWLILSSFSGNYFNSPNILLSNPATLPNRFLKIIFCFQDKCSALPSAAVLTFNWLSIMSQSVSVWFCLFFLIQFIIL